MSEPYFKGFIPSQDPQREALLNRVESAQGEELEALKDEISTMSALAIDILADRLLTAATTSTLFSVLVESMKTPHELTDGKTINLMTIAANYAIKEIFTTRQFEEVCKKLIEGAQFDRGFGSYTVQTVVNTVLTNSLRTVSGIKTLHHNRLPILDAALAGDIIKASKGAGRDLRLNSTSQLVSMIRLPETLKALIGVSLQEDGLFQAVGVIKHLFILGKLSPEYIDIASSSMDIDVFCQACRDANAADLSVVSINNFVDAFGEDALLPKPFFKKMSGILYAGKLPFQLNMLGNQHFDDDRLPNLTKFVLMNIKAIFSVLDSSSLAIRYGLLTLCSKHGLAAEALDFEANSWRDSFNTIVKVSDQASSADLLYSLKMTLPAEYGIALQSIGRIGLINAEPLLKEVRPEILKDLIEIHDPEPSERKQLMKLYPQSKGIMLEDALGL